MFKSKIQECPFLKEEPGVKGTQICIKKGFLAVGPLNGGGGTKKKKKNL